MTLILRVDRNERTKVKLIEYLTYIAKEIEKGMIVGEDWEMEGEETLEEDESEDHDW